MDIQKVIDQSDDRLLAYFAKGTLVSLFTDDDPPGKPNSDKLPWMLLGLITIVGTEPLKVLLRRNIGKLSLSLNRLITASVLYFLWAVLIYFLIQEKTFAGSHLPDFWTSDTALLAAIVFYILIGFSILILGIIERKKANERYRQDKNDILGLIYRGESVFFTATNGAELKKVWSFREPVTCLIIGLLITALNPFMGGPIVGTSISFWVNEVFQVNNIANITEDKIGNHQRRNSQKPPFEQDGGDEFVVQ